MCVFRENASPPLFHPHTRSESTRACAPGNVHRTAAGKTKRGGEAVFDDKIHKCVRHPGRSPPPFRPSSVPMLTSLLRLSGTG